MRTHEPYDDKEIEMLCEAYRLRTKRVYTMREVADKVGVQRVPLIEALEEWIERGMPGWEKKT